MKYSLKTADSRTKWRKDIKEQDHESAEKGVRNNENKEQCWI